jgi:hypothetical protein
LTPASRKNTANITRLIFFIIFTFLGMSFCLKIKL